MLNSQNKIQKRTSYYTSDTNSDQDESKHSYEGVVYPYNLPKMQPNKRPQNKQRHASEPSRGDNIGARKMKDYKRTSFDSLDDIHFGNFSIHSMQ